MAKTSTDKCPSIIRKLSGLKGHDIAVSIDKIKEVYQPGESQKIISALTTLAGVRMEDGYLIIPRKYMHAI